MEASAALSELAFSLRSCKGRHITRADFETTLKRYLSGSHADQQISQLWDKVRSYIALHGLKVHHEIKGNVYSCADMRGKSDHRARGAMLIPPQRDAAERVPGQSPSHSPPPSPTFFLQYAQHQGEWVATIIIRNYCSYSSA